MCGIFGIFRLGTPGSEELRPLIKNFLQETASRGTDASGLAWLTSDGKLRHLKAPVKPDIFARDAVDKHVPKDFKAVIGHTRHATQGDPKKNENNHPLPSLPEFKFATVHNGIVWSKYEGQRQPRAEVDSHIIVLNIEDEMAAGKPFVEAVKAAYAKMAGSMTTATLEGNGNLVIAKHSNPVVLGYLPQWNVLVFASTEDILRKSLGCFLEKLFGVFQPYYEWEPKDDTLIHIADGVFKTDVIKTNTGWTTFGSAGRKDEWKYTRYAGAKDGDTCSVAKTAPKSSVQSVILTPPSVEEAMEEISPLGLPPQGGEVEIELEKEARKAWDQTGLHHKAAILRALELPVGQPDFLELKKWHKLPIVVQSDLADAFEMGMWTSRGVVKAAFEKAAKEADEPDDASA